MLLVGQLYLIGIIDKNKCFTFNPIQSNILNLQTITISSITLHASYSLRKTQDEIIIHNDETDIRFLFTFGDRGYTIININQFFAKINHIRMSNATNLPFEITYNVFN